MKIESSIPNFLFAPGRRINSSSNIKEELSIPDIDLSNEALQLQATRYGRMFRDTNRDNVSKIFEELNKLAKVLLANTPLFENVKFYLTDPVNFNQYQELVNRVYTQAIELEQNITPGKTVRIEITNNSLRNLDITFNNKIYEMRIDGFDMVFTNNTNASFLPTFTIKEKDIDNSEKIRVGFEITPEGDLIFADIVEVTKPDYTVGVAFIRPGENTILRENCIWASHQKRMGEFN